MSRRKGEITSAQINRDYAFQVTVAADADDQVQSRYKRWKVIHDFCQDPSVAPLGHTFVKDDRWWNVHCFAKPDAAEKFKARFDGEMVVR